MSNSDNNSSGLPEDEGTFRIESEASGPNNPRNRSRPRRPKSMPVNDGEWENEADEETQQLEQDSPSESGHVAGVGADVTKGKSTPGTTRENESGARQDSGEKGLAEDEREFGAVDNAPENSQGAGGGTRPTRPSRGEMGKGNPSGDSRGSGNEDDNSRGERTSQNQTGLDDAKGANEPSTSDQSTSQNGIEPSKTDGVGAADPGVADAQNPNALAAYGKEVAGTGESLEGVVARPAAAGAGLAKDAAEVSDKAGKAAKAADTAKGAGDVAKAADAAKTAGVAAQGAGDAAQAAGGASAPGVGSIKTAKDGFDAAKKGDAAGAAGEGAQVLGEMAADSFAPGSGELVRKAGNTKAGKGLKKGVGWGVVVAIVAPLMVFAMIGIIVFSAILGIVGGAQEQQSQQCVPYGDNTIQIGDVPTKGDETTARYIWDTLTGMGFTEESVAGILGNLEQESGVNPKVVQSNGVGHGLAQWSTGGRWDTGTPNLVAYADKEGLDRWSAEAQVGFMLLEMKNSWGGFNLKKFMKMTDILEATTYFHHVYEKSADSEDFVRKVRGGYAKNWYNRLKGSGSISDDVTKELVDKELKGAGKSNAASIASRTQAGRPAAAVTSIESAAQDNAIKKSVYIVGDSLTVGVKPYLDSRYEQNGGFELVGVDATQGISAMTAVKQSLDKKIARDADVWVVALGTNFGGGKEEFSDAVRYTVKKSDGKPIYWINVRNDDNIGNQNAVNRVLEKMSGTYSNLSIVDYNGSSRKQKGIMAGDGIHLTPDGYKWRSNLYIPSGSASEEVVGGAGVEERLSRAIEYAKKRPGTVAISVRNATGKLVGGTKQAHKVKIASMIKAFYLAAFLDSKKKDDISVENMKLLEAMITESSDDASVSIRNKIGYPGNVNSFVRDKLGISDFSAAPQQGVTLVDASQMSKAFSNLETSMPDKHREYGMKLLASIVPDQQWGMPEAAEAQGWEWHVKGGWLDGIVSQTGILEAGGETYYVAVLQSGLTSSESDIDENPTKFDGPETIEQVVKLLLAPAATPEQQLDENCDPIPPAGEGCAPLPPDRVKYFREFNGRFEFSAMTPDARLVIECVYSNFGPLLSPSTYEPGHQPSWDRAVDLMLPESKCVSSGPVKEEVDGIATFLMEHHKELGIDYLIWQDKSWSAGADPKKPPPEWKTDNYNNGDCNNTHGNHIHVSVYGKAGTGILTGGGSSAGSWILPTKSADWVNEKKNSGTDPGMRLHPTLGYTRCHAGWDIAAPEGQAIKAVADGVASKHPGTNGGAGNYVVIKHGGKLFSQYFHMSRFSPKSSGPVKQGDVIGYVGSTGGISTGAHLHVEARLGGPDGQVLDPREFFFGTPRQTAC